MTTPDPAAVLIRPDGEIVSRRPVSDWQDHCDVGRCYWCGQPVGTLHKPGCAAERCPECDDATLDHKEADWDCGLMTPAGAMVAGERLIAAAGRCGVGISPAPDKRDVGTVLAVLSPAQNGAPAVAEAVARLRAWLGGTRG